ncbi:MAG: hypothetical protein M5R40_04415 [Anaerolineae bacterium]|nr:hypothetical protein [Anaerolineae bacterium]
MAQAPPLPWALFWRAAAGALVTLPLLLYTAYHFATNPVFAAWSAQNVLISPHPFHYLAGYIVLIVPALWGLRWAWRRGRTRDLLLVSWVVAAPVLVYLPVNVQRRLAEGVFVPLGVLAVAGLRLLAPQMARWLRARRLRLGRRRTWSLALGVTLALILPTSLLVVAGGAALAARPAWPAFHPAGEIAAMDWLGAHARPGAVVLSAFGTGNYLPARADVRVYLGHGPETLDADAKRGVVEAFFAGALDAESRAALYAAHGIDYVFYGPQEGATPGAPLPGWAADLRLAYQADGYSIFEVAR